MSPFPLTDPLLVLSHFFKGNVKSQEQSYIDICPLLPRSLLLANYKTQKMPLLCEKISKRSNS